ncbi:glycosyltransferase [Maribacter stanieri]|uniref:glycosyltransferase n=1 Tax=Maribacter stanieri TaxID=440514 RepID=UPI002494C8ED|nr:glycosyltransferase [Maribacter stanieri]
MNIIFFTHPRFLGHQSMPRFANMLVNGMKKKGHQVEVWTPKPNFHKLPATETLKKWLGYIDQFIVFPIVVKQRLKSVDKNTLFVFTDNALGPWVPLVSNMNHVIHCHDFLAQRSAFEGIDENLTGFTGKLYQKIIKKGYTKGNNFISVSKKTQSDLHKLLNFTPAVSEVVYNAMNRDFAPQKIDDTRIKVAKETGIAFLDGYILHVGGNQWYKNRIGVVEIYNELRTHFNITKPLLLVGTEPNNELLNLIVSSPFQKDIHSLSECSDEMVKNLYSGASLLLFPSLDEGFGWPIAEAMASGCLVVTTNEPPMTEVGGQAGFYIPKRPLNLNNSNWALESAGIVNDVLSLNPITHKKNVLQGIENVGRFKQKKMLEAVEEIYSKIITKE